MPTYEYACGACGHHWDEVQRITEPPLELCPKCAKSAAHRLISGGTHFILKGGGWYSDLYASPKAAAKKDEAGETGKKDEASKKDEAGAKHEPAAATDGKAKPEAKPAATSTTPAPTSPTSPST